MNTFSLVSDKRTVNAFVIRVGRPNQVMKRGVSREAGRGGGGAGVALCKWVGQPPWAWPSPLLLLLGLHLCAAIERQQRKCSVFFDSVQGFFSIIISFFFLLFFAYSAHATSEFGLSLVQNTLRNTKIKQANAARGRRKRNERKKHK